ncbi:Valine--tRNA ligase [Phycisphaerae bacterium RAS1]|nr:Valine--tRNA ligase [Phycisphaerae bacterium RAS1]
MSTGGSYDPRSIEPAILEFWETGDKGPTGNERRSYFNADLPDASARGNAAKPFVIPIPPPNVTGALHLGHAINNTVQDIIVRWKRMQGFNTLWMPGIDHAGIATQAVVEKRLKAEQNLTRHDVGRDGLVAKIWAWKDEYSARILGQLRRMGCSCDWRRLRFTLDEICAKAVYEAFFQFFKAGLIYRGKRMVNWDAALQTAVADDELVHETVKTNLWHIRYPILKRDQGIKGSRDQGESQSLDPLIPRSLDPSFLVVATTRPETMLGDTAVAVHPDDERYRHLIGQHVLLPLMNRPIPIIADGELVKQEFGTGCVKVTPGHDPNDYACWERHRGQADEFAILDLLTPDGKINEVGRGSSVGTPCPTASATEGRRYGSSDSEVGRYDYSGLPKEEARKRVVADLESLGLLENVEPYVTEVAHSDRSKTPVEPLRSEQWFMKMSALAEPTMEAVRDGRVSFTPERYAKTYLDWLGEKRDWCISRQLWWGHRIPVWTFKAGVNIAPTPSPHSRLDALIEEGRLYCRYEVDNREINSLAAVIGHPAAEKVLHGASASDDIEWRKLSFCPRSDFKEDFAAIADGLGMEQDADVLDTWFSSALWPFSTLGWPHDGAHEPSRDRKGAVLPDAHTTSDRQPLPHGRGSEVPKEPLPDGRGSEEPLPHGRGSEVPKEPLPDGRGSERPRDPNPVHPSRDREGAVLRRAASGADPQAYLITFHTYGTWLHGAEQGSVDREHNIPGEPYVAADSQREREEFVRLAREPVKLDDAQRALVDRTIHEVAEHRGWTLHALNVRTNHVHVVVSAPGSPERVMNDFKSYASRRMVEARVFPPDTPAWSRHGSTRYLWTMDDVRGACEYVDEHQGGDLGTGKEPLPHGRGSEGREEPLPHGRGSERREKPLPHGRGSEGREEPLPYGRGSEGREEPLPHGRGSEGREKPLPHGRGSENTGRGSERPAEPDLSTPSRSDFEHFFPTDTLITGRGIITLWVARMVMTSLYFTGRVPFNRVYINPTILDGRGEIMNKSKGNGLDPLDIIEAYGTDALRFTLAQSATETQDLRMPVAYRCPHCGHLTPHTSVVPHNKYPIDVHKAACGSCKKPFATVWAPQALKDELGVALDTSERFELGRNFCNKLWQAATGYIIPAVKDVRIAVRTATIDGKACKLHTSCPPKELNLFDRWIRTRAQHCIAEVAESFEHFEFARACESIRTFFWTEFCDWYLEESKDRVKGPDDDANDAKIVLLQTLDVVLGLLHPIAPFVTEAIWKKLSVDPDWPEVEEPIEGRPATGLQRHYELVSDTHQTEAPAPALVVAEWPGVWKEVQDSLVDRQVGNLLQPIIRALRDKRTSINVIRSASKEPALRELPLGVIRASGDDERVIRDFERLICRLGSCKELQIGPTVAKPTPAMSAVLTGVEVFVPLAGLADPSIEKARLEREMAEVAAAIGRVEAKLANEGFVAKAPAALIEQERARMAEMQQRLAAMRANLADIS